MAFKIRKKNNVNIKRVVTKLVATLIALWAGGVIVTEIGTVMTCTYSPFYKGLALIGWTVADSVTVINATAPTTCNTANSALTAGTYYNVVTSTSGAGILAVIGIIGIASVVLEFVSINF